MPSNAMTSCMTSSSTTWFNPFVQPNTDLWPRFEPPAKINFKKEKEKGGSDQVGPLTLTKKSKFSKRTYPTQFFEYIPILGSVSSFETRKLCKRPISRSWLLHKSWPKVKIFKNDLFCSIFFVHFNFGVCPIIWDSKIAQMTQFQDSWLLYLGWPKVKIFKLNLSCSVFPDLEITNLIPISEVLIVSKT